MSDITRKRNDTTPLTGVLKENGSAADLSNVSKVEFFMAPDESSPLKASGEANIVDEASGKVRYEFSADEVDTSDFYLIEWQATYADGMVQSFPHNEYITLEIKDDLA